MKKRWNVIGVLLVLLLFSYCEKRKHNKLTCKPVMYWLG